MDKYYYDDKTGFVSADKLYQKVKGKFSRKEVDEYVKKQELSQMFKPYRKPHRYLPIYGKPNSYQMDLAFLPKFKRQNKGHWVLMVVININTRYLVVIALKDKTQSSLVKGFERVLKDTRIEHLATDKEAGLGHRFITTLEKNDVSHYYVDHAWRAERVIRTIKGRLNKMMEYKQSVKWIDVIDDVVENYNSTVHSSIGIAPKNVGRKEEQRIIKEAQAKTVGIVGKLDIEVGDKVRIGNPKKLFEKEGKGYSDKVYTVVEVDKLRVKLKDENGNVVRKRYLPYQLLEIEDVEARTGSKVDEVRKEEGRRITGERRLRKTGVGDLAVQDKKLRGKGEWWKNLIGVEIRKRFKGKWYDGKVVSYKSPYFRIKYKDGDEEEMSWKQVEKWMK